MSRVGEKVKAIREKANLSQKQFGKKLGVNESFISEVESGRKVVNDSLIARIKKLFGEDINDISMNYDEEAVEEKPRKAAYAPKNTEANESWISALGAILKEVPVYDYYFDKTFGSKKLPVESNKIEGFNQDKVFFIKISDDDMAGFRIMKGDLAFGHIIHEPENNAVCLIENGNERIIRQVKRLEANKALLISNNGNVHTEAVNIKDIKVIGKLERVEFKL